MDIKEMIFSEVEEALIRGETFLYATVVKASQHFEKEIGKSFLLTKDGKFSGSLSEAIVPSLKAEDLWESVKETSYNIVTLFQSTGNAGCSGSTGCNGSEEKVSGSALDFAAGYFVELFVEKVLTPPRLVVFGGGHIAKPLVTIAGLLGYEITVVDDRPLYANKARFPEAKTVICEDFEKAVKNITCDEATYIVIVTRGHRHDKVCLHGVIESSSPYVGMIGSRRRVKAIFEELDELDIPKEKLARIFSPIGLKIGAETPEEIALSIMAEITAFRRGGLRDGIGTCKSHQ